MTEPQAPSSTRFIESDRVEGTTVHTADGKHVGTIKRFIIDRQSGMIAYVVISFGGLLDLGHESFTVPWAKFTYDAELARYSTDIAEDELRGAPRFADENAALDEAQEEELRAHFRIPPPWRGAV